jgi:hypothetical protein
VCVLAKTAVVFTVVPSVLYIFSSVKALPNKVATVPKSGAILRKPFVPPEIVSTPFRINLSPLL